MLNGRKSWVTSAPVAKYILVFTMTAPEKKHRGITAFLVDTDRPGFVVARRSPSWASSRNASATSEIVFEDYRLPVENRLGAEGEGFKIAMVVLDAGAHRHRRPGAGHRRSGLRGQPGLCPRAGGVWAARSASSRASLSSWRT